MRGFLNQGNPKIIQNYHKLSKTGHSHHSHSLSNFKKHPDMFHRDTTAEVPGGVPLLARSSPISVERPVPHGAAACDSTNTTVWVYQVPCVVCRWKVAPHGMKLNGEKKSNFKQVVWSSLKCSILRQAYKSADAVWIHHDPNTPLPRSCLSRRDIYDCARGKRCLAEHGRCRYWYV